MTANSQKSREMTPDENFRELYKRFAQLNDKVSALLAPAWGSEIGLIPTDHPLYQGEKPASGGEVERRLEATYRTVDTFKAERDTARAAIERVRAVARDWGPTLLPRSEAHRLLTDLCAALDGEQPTPAPAATEATELEKTARVLSALHRAAEDTVTRVITLHEQWVAAGPPPLGASLARWWDARLAELHNAIQPPAVRQQTPDELRERADTDDLTIHPPADHTTEK